MNDKAKLLKSVLQSFKIQNLKVFIFSLPSFCDINFEVFMPLYERFVAPSKNIILRKICNSPSSPRIYYIKTMADRSNQQSTSSKTTKSSTSGRAVLEMSGFGSSHIERLRTSEENQRNNSSSNKTKISVSPQSKANHENIKSLSEMLFNMTKVVTELSNRVAALESCVNNLTIEVATSQRTSQLALKNQIHKRAQSAGPMRKSVKQLPVRIA